MTPDPIQQLADPDEGQPLLTERQAAAYYYREVAMVPREEAAERMGVATSTLDDYRGTAVAKVEGARATLEAIDAIDEQLHPSVPDECAECGSALPNPFATDEDGRALCLDCAGVDPAQLE